MSQDHTTAELTLSERLVVKRRRLGCTQIEMAIKLNVSIRTYQAWEESIDGDPPPETILFRGLLRPHEWCYIRRRRSGLSRAQVATRIGRSLGWVTLMERGRRNCEILTQFWESRTSSGVHSAA